MTTYICNGWFVKFKCQANSTLELRKICRQWIGWRKSARFKYNQIGANTFKIENCLGWTVLDIYRQNEWNN